MQTAKLFKNGRSQAVRLPKEFQMPGEEVYVRKEGKSVVLTPKDVVWEEFLKSLGSFKGELVREQPEQQERDLDFG